METPLPPRSRALRSLDDHHIILVAGVALQALAPHADLVTDEFVAELERVQPLGGDGAVTQSDHHAAKDAFELLLQGFERIQRIGMLDPLADVENRGRKLAGLLRRSAGELG